MRVHEDENPWLRITLALMCISCNTLEQLPTLLFGLRDRPKMLSMIFLVLSSEKYH